MNRAMDAVASAFRRKAQAVSRQEAILIVRDKKLAINRVLVGCGADAGAD
jgi:hypothetical protein